MNISAYLGVAGLVDVGYRFYTTAEVAVAARVTTGIVDAGDGWYSAEVTLPATAESVRWDSTGTATAIAREYWPDPWGLLVPDGYPSGTAGYILGNNLNASVSTRATPAQVQTELGTYGGLKPTVAGRTLDITTTGEAGIDLDNTVGTLAKGTDLTGFNDISSANVQTELTNYGALKPTTAGRTLDVTTTGEAGVDWANVGAPTTTQNLSGTTVGTATSVTNTVGITATAVDNIWAKSMTELASVPGVTASTLSALQWVFLLSRNKITQSATTQILRNDADSANISTSTVSDDGTTFVRGEFS